MQRNFDKALKLVLKHEGGFVNHPADPGGATNKGITIGTFRRYISKNGTVDDLKRITDAEVAKVYRKQYWDKVKGDDLPDGVDYAVFDFAVNSGPSRAAKHLQKVLKVVQDGAIGPITLGAVNKASKTETIIALCQSRMVFLRGLKTWGTFGKGWTNRVTDVQRDALDMLSNAVLTPQKPVSASQPVPAPVQPKAPEPAPTASPESSGGIWAWLISLFTKKEA